VLRAFSAFFFHFVVIILIVGVVHCDLDKAGILTIKALRFSRQPTRYLKELKAVLRERDSGLSNNTP
jgi:hypothetical protein